MLTSTNEHLQTHALLLFGFVPLRNRFIHQSCPTCWHYARQARSCNPESFKKSLCAKTQAGTPYTCLSDQHSINLAAILHDLFKLGKNTIIYVYKLFSIKDLVVYRTRDMYKGCKDENTSNNSKHFLPSSLIKH